jgi:prevent-host-death family protein
MTTLTASEARADLFKLIDKTAQSHQPIQIKGRRNSAVLIDDEDWRSIQETLYLMNIPGMRESIVEGMKTPHTKMAKKLKW